MNIKNLLLMLKFSIIFFILLLSIWIIADQTLLYFKNDILKLSHLDKGDTLRYASPYIEFKGKPNAGEHDQEGYRRRYDSTPKPTTSIKIAFFGGSTGYLGEPSIAKIIEDDLERKLGKPVFVKNFSVVSSNHRQHLHNILETYAFFQPDIVLFYGGYNETGQTGYYDPRPGYPYSYFFRTDTSPIIQWLLNHSPTFYLLNLVGKRFLLWDFTGLDQLRKKHGVFSEQWNEEVVSKYFETIALAKSVSEAFPSTLCKGKAQFIFFYQPYLVPAELSVVNAQIISKISKLNYGHDLSNILDNKKTIYFEDLVHVTPEGNAILGQAVSNAILLDSRLHKCFY